MSEMKIFDHRICPVRYLTCTDEIGLCCFVFFKKMNSGHLRRVNDLKDLLSPLEFVHSRKQLQQISPIQKVPVSRGNFCMNRCPLG